MEKAEVPDSDGGEQSPCPSEYYSDGGGDGDGDCEPKEQSPSEYSNEASTISSVSTADLSLTRSLSTNWSVISSAAPTILNVSFNQDSSCFSAGTDRDFRIFSCSPFVEQYRREFGGNGGGIGTVQMLFRSNIYALIGGGSNPQYPPNKVMIWDDQQGRCTGELSFKSDVKSVRVRRDRIVVVFVQKIFVYNFHNLKLVSRIDTATNLNAQCEINHHHVEPMVLVCPGLQKGQIRVELYGTNMTKFFTAHNSSIACIALANDGRLVATASSKGTLVRVFNVLDGSLLKEVRRGADIADIHSLAFSSGSQWLAVSSDKGTVHVFSLKVYSEETRRSSSIYPLSYIKGMLPNYFSSEWSMSQFHLPEGLQYIVAFGRELDTVVIVGMDGSFYRCRFDPVSGGEMEQLECVNFMQPEDAF